MLRYVAAVSGGSGGGADLARLIDWDGERCVPWAGEVAMLYEHYHRYLWASLLLAGRDVLDLGSGEGYGAAILSRQAARVTGVDIDAQAVEHAAARYASPSVSFLSASALDLAPLPDGRFDAVVAFEMIEHVQDHERLLGEVRRVMTERGLLIVSTPDRNLYSEAAGQVNPYHEHELSLAEFRALLLSRFANVAIWGQRTITGSHLSAIEADEAAVGARTDFFVAAAEEGIEPIEEPPPLFFVALASDAPLPAVAASSTLSDYGLELLRQTERAHGVAVAERDRLLSEANAKLASANALLDEKYAEAVRVAARVSELESQLLRQGDELAELERFRRRVEGSVSWQLFQRARTALYRVLGEDTALGRALGSALRLLGRLTVHRRR